MTGPSSRLLPLLSLLQARRDWPGALLAERLGVTVRTVRRDVDRLRALGYPVRATKGPDGGYRLDAGTDLPPLLLDDEQAVALAVALQAAAAGGAEVGTGAARALATLRQVMPARLRHRVDAVQVSALRHPATPAVDPDVLVALTAAVRAREVLRLDHRAAGAPPGSPGPVAPRRVEPHHLLTRGGRWYLLAWDLDRVDWRTFRVDRVTPRTPTGPRFTPRDVPGGDVAAFVEARFRGADPAGGAGGTSGPGAGGWPCQGVVDLDRPATEVAPHLVDGTVEPLGPGRCRVSTGAWSWVGLAASLGRFDADVHVVGPPALAEAFDALAARYARAARPGPPLTPSG